MLGRPLMQTLLLVLIFVPVLALICIFVVAPDWIDPLEPADRVVYAEVLRVYQAAGDGLGRRLLIKTEKSKQVFLGPSRIGKVGERIPLRVFKRRFTGRESYLIDDELVLLMRQ